MPSRDNSTGGEGVNNNASNFTRQNQSHPPSAASGIMNFNGAGNLSSLANKQRMMPNGSMNNNATGKNLPPQGQHAFVQPNYSDQQMQAAYAVAAMAEKSLGAKNPYERQPSEDNTIEDKKGTNLMNGSLKGSVNQNFSNTNISTRNMEMNPSGSAAVNPTSMMMMAASNNGRTSSSVASNLFRPATNGSAGNPYLSSQQNQAGLTNGLGASMGGFSAATASKGAAVENDTSIPSSISGVSILPLTKKKKIKGKPKRPLSAYNLFFKHERKRILASLEEEKEREAALIEAKVQNAAKKEDAEEDEKNKDNNGVDDANKKVEEEKKKEKGDISEDTDTKEAEEKSQEGDKEMKKEGTEDGDKEMKKEGTEEGDKEMKKEGTEEGDKEKEGTEEEKSKKQRHGKIGFETLAKTIGQRWSQLEEADMKKYKDMANEDMKRYKREMEIFLTKKQEADAEESALKAAAKKAAEEKAMANQPRPPSYENQYQMLLQQQQNRNQMNQLGWNPTTQLQGSGDMNNNLLMQALLLQQQQQQLHLMRQQQFAQQQSQYGRPEQPSLKKQKFDNLNSFGDQQYMFQQSQPSAGTGSEMNMGALYGNTNQSLNGSNLFSNNFNAFNNMANMGGVNTMGLMNPTLNNMSGFSGMNNGMMGSANFMQSHNQQFQNEQQSMQQDGNAQSGEYQNVYNSGKTSPAMYNMRS